jgi:hypothetical protein
VFEHSCHRTNFHQGAGVSYGALCGLRQRYFPLRDSPPGGRQPKTSERGSDPGSSFQDHGLRIDWARQRTDNRQDAVHEVIEEGKMSEQEPEEGSEETPEEETDPDASDKEKVEGDPLSDY